MELPLPDVEAMVVEFCLDHAEVSGVFAERVYTKLPASPDFPLVVLHRSGGVPRVRYFLDEARVQFDVYGQSKEEASDAARTLHAALEDMPATVLTDGVVNAVTDSVALTWVPTQENARPRYTFEVAITAHPVGS